jgi:hypothetical protein
VPKSHSAKPLVRPTAKDGRRKGRDAVLAQFGFGKKHKELLLFTPSFDKSE